jgi:hypothetical protein
MALIDELKKMRDAAVAMRDELWAAAQKTAVESTAWHNRIDELEAAIRGIEALRGPGMPVEPQPIPDEPELFDDAAEADAREQLERDEDEIVTAAALEDFLTLPGAVKWEAGECPLDAAVDAEVFFGPPVKDYNPQRVSGTFKHLNWTGAPITEHGCRQAAVLAYRIIEPVATLGPPNAFLTSIMERGGTWHDGGDNPAPDWFCDIYVPAGASSLGETHELEGQPSNAYVWNGWEVAYVKTQPMYAPQPVEEAPALNEAMQDEREEPVALAQPEWNEPVTSGAKMFSHGIQSEQKPERKFNPFAMFRREDA